MKKVIRLSSVHLGNGITVFKANTEEAIAHIRKYREIKWYVDIDTLSVKTYDEVLAIARLDDREVSATQDTKVFTTRPKPFYIITGVDKNNKRFVTYTETPQHYNIWKGTLWQLQKDGSRKRIKEY
jgi:hypothetical protein